MVRTFELEDYEKLKPYKDHLTRAFYGKYTYGLTRATFETLSSIYKSLGYSQRLDYTCGACLLNLCKTLGSYFFPFEEKLNMEKNQEPAKSAKRKVGEYNIEGELIREFESVTKAVAETGVSKGNIYKSLKESVAIDGKTFKYIDEIN